MTTVNYRGIPCTTVWHDANANTYTLYDDLGSYVAILKSHEFLSNPQLRMLPHGRHRRTNSPNNRSPLDITNNALRTLANLDPNYGTGLSAQALANLRPGRVTSLPQATWRTFNLIDQVEINRPPLKRSDVIAGEIIGHRCWRIENGLLRSVYQTDLWYPKDILSGRELGDWDSRGIHAWKDPASKEYHDYIRGYLNAHEDYITNMLLYGRHSRDNAETKPAMATGTVFLWGDVVEHTRGYRAEYARVRSLDWLYPDANMMGRETIVLNDLRSKYHV